MSNINVPDPEANLEVRQLTDDELGVVSGGTYTKQKRDGTGAGNVAAKWSVAQGAAA